MGRRLSILLHLVKLVIFALMKKLRISCFLFLLLSQFLMAQFQFSGRVTESLLEGDIYLSLVEDYRKISGVHEEQILMKTAGDSSGYFQFSGDHLPLENRIYRIHVDTCPETEQAVNHFAGHCKNSREVTFIAHNKDTLHFPFSFDDEMFCSLIAKNKKSKALLQIDSLKNDMIFAIASNSGEAGKNLNVQKWFQTLQTFGVQLQEPLAELYSYSFLSDRSHFLHDYYLEDLASNSYYKELQTRMEASYPDTKYTKQYVLELKADLFLLQERDSYPWWIYAIGGVLILFFLVNFYIIGKWFQHKQKKENPAVLSKQEDRIKQLILEDKSNKEIADTLFISVSTVKSHINNIYKKLNINSREELKNLNGN
jgi:DNA-binding CsgD family transcriptional regulator